MFDNLNNYWLSISEGDEKSFELLFKKIYAPLCWYSALITKDRQISEEIVQDILHKIWEDRAKIKIHTSFKAFLFQSVRNLSINSLKRKETNRFSVNQIQPDEIWAFIANNSESDEYIVERISSSDTERIIDDAIESLTPQCKKVFKLSRFDNLSNDEIAAKLSISISTVKTHISDALVKIAIALKRKT